MAINREKREDLMRDATAYSRRISILTSHGQEAIFIGIRQQGGWSVYFGEDPVYQFNRDGELRRAHFADQNYAATDGRLCLLHRDRSGGHVEIQRIYSADTEQHILTDCHKRLKELFELIQSSSFQSMHQFPVSDVELMTEIVDLVRAASLDLRVSNTANA